MEQPKQSHASDQDIAPSESLSPSSDETPSDDMETAQTNRLRAAIQENDAEAVESLLDLDQDLLNVAFDYNFRVTEETKTLHVTPMAMAAILGQDSIMDVLMSREGDINAGIGNKQQTSLHLAAKYGWVAPVNLLLSKGANVNREDKNGWTALHIASYNGHLEIVGRLLKADADTSLRTIDQRTAFHMACLRDHLQVLKQWWDRGPSTQIHDGDTHSDQPLHLAAINDSHKVVPWLLEKGAEIEHQGKWGWTPLQLACAEGSVQVAKVLLKRGGNIHVKNNGFNSPVQLACKNVRPGILELLTARGARISEIDPNGNTCFHQVVFNKHAFSDEHREVLQRLVGEGADINKPNLSGRTPLHHACRKKKTDLMECLLDLGADINKRGPSHGITALIKACCTPNTSAVEILLNKNADMSTRNNHGLTALALACRHGHLGNVKALILKGAAVDTRDKEGHTPLYTAAVFDRLKIVIELLKTPAYYPEYPMQTPALTENAADVPEIEETLWKVFETDGYDSLDTLHTVMYWAVANGSLELAQKCIKCKEQVLHWRRQSATWLHIAAQHGQAKLIPILSRAGVLEMATGKLTAMHLAARVKTGFFETTKNLLGIMGAGSQNPALARVAAIVKRDARDESPLSISIKRKKNELSNLFWSEIQVFGTADKEFLRRNPHEANDILEVVAQFEKPGNEDTLRHLLREWCPRPPVGDSGNFTTLEWAVHSSQAAVVWWLLSNGGYSSGHAIGKAQILARTLPDGVGSLIQDLLQHPPSVLDNVANPNDDRPPKLPNPTEESSGSLDSRGTIVDIFSDGRITSTPSPYPTIRRIVYDPGPDALMKAPGDLHHRHLDTLKRKIEALGGNPGNSALHHAAPAVPRADGWPQENPSGAETPTHHIREDPQVRWVHLPSTKMHWMRDLVCRLSNDSKRSEMRHRVVMRHFNRSWTELAAGAGKHYMKPQCTVDLIDRPKNELDGEDKSQRRTLCAALYMPYLTMGTYNPSRSNGSTEHHVASPRDAEQDSNEPRGLEESIQSRNSRDITHKPMTLDQYYYPILTNTDVRDNDQVLSKFLKKKREQDSQARGENQNGSTDTAENDPRARGQALQKQILIVDQLWMWIVDEKTIITATTEYEALDHSRYSLLHTVLDNMIHGESRSRFERPTSVRSMMELILGCATGFFMKKFVPVLDDLNRKDPMEIFLESIRDVANEETRLFDAFRKALEDEESQRDKLRNRSGNTPSVKEMPQNPYHIISPETALLHQIRDIRDELRMLRSIAEDQEVVWKQAFDSDVWKEVFDLGDLKDGLQYYHPCTPTDVKKNLDDMVVEAEVTNDSINTLLDLRQKQASIKEAEFGRIQANDSARQSNSVFIFTVITIVFLPLSFLSSLFALDVSSFPHESGDVKYQGWWLFPILFGVTAIVSIPAIILAWNVNAISDWFQPQKRSGSPGEQHRPEVVRNGGSETGGRMRLLEEVWNRRGQGRHGAVLPQPNR